MSRRDTPQGQRPTQWRRVFLLLIFVVATTRFCLTIHYFEKAVVPRGPEAMRVAFSLYQGDGWADPYSTLPTGPSAHEAPLFPALVAGIYKVFGTEAVGWFALQFFEALALLGQIMLIPLVAESLGIGLETGLIAALIATFGLEGSFCWEHSYVGLLLTLVALLAGKFLGALDEPQDLKPAQGNSPWASPTVLASALGVVWGTVLLVNPTPALIWAAWLVLGWWTVRHKSPRLLLPILILPLLMILPWAWRNYRVMHSLVLIRSNLGLELSVSNNQCAGYSLAENHQNNCFQHPNEKRREAEQVVELGEVNYNRARLREAIAWITANPTRFRRLTLERFAYFWFPTDAARFKDAFLRLMLQRSIYFWLPFTGRFRDAISVAVSTQIVNLPVQPWTVYVATVLSIPGMFMLWQRSRRAAVICGSFLVLYPPIYYVVQFDERYRFPILWVTFLVGAVAIRPATDWAYHQLTSRWTRFQLVCSEMLGRTELESD
jgi:hypothetical protein